MPYEPLTPPGISPELMARYLQDELRRIADLLREIEERLDALENPGP